MVTAYFLMEVAKALNDRLVGIEHESNIVPEVTNVSSVMRLQRDWGELRSMSLDVLIKPYENKIDCTESPVLLMK